MNDKRAFGLRIKAARENRKLTLEQVSEFCNVSLSTWKQYERGERLPGLTNFIQLCVVLRVTPEYLFGPELDEIKGDLNEIKQLKMEIDQLHPTERAVIQAAVSKQLEIRNNE